MDGLKKIGRFIRNCVELYIPIIAFVALFLIFCFQVFMEAVSAALREKGVENVIITLGGNGSAVAGANGVSYTPCVKMPDVKDPTAAGDSFVAAFCTAVTAGLPETQALAFASHTAAITVSRMGAMPSLPTMEEVQSLLRQREYTGFEPAELDALR